MKHLFVPYELALALKEKKYNELCIAHYSSEGELHTIEDYIKLGLQPEYFIRNMNGKEWMKEICSAPTYQQVQDWFREKHQVDFYHTIYSTDMIKTSNGAIKGKYNISACCEKWNPHVPFSGLCSDDFYESWRAAIEEALKLI